MKAKLIKTESGYNLFTQGFLKASTETDLINQMNIEEGNIRYHLSKQNCDEIFGVVDVEKLAEDHPLEVSNASHGFGIKDGIVYGFNKAIELNKDKLFTLQDLRKTFQAGRDFELAQYDFGENDPNPQNTFKVRQKILNEDNWVDYLQPPTEIEVEIEMFKSDDIKSVEKDWYKIGEPKLDENRYLILKRI
jgi:hypothetical protein